MAASVGTGIGSAVAPRLEDSAANDASVGAGRLPEGTPGRVGESTDQGRKKQKNGERNPLKSKDFGWRPGGSGP